jgi:hypothetical protein
MVNSPNLMMQWNMNHQMIPMQMYPQNNLNGMMTQMYNASLNNNLMATNIP